MSFSKSIFVKFLEIFTGMFESVFENRKEKRFLLKKRNWTSPSQPIWTSPAPAHLLSPQWPSPLAPLLLLLSLESVLNTNEPNQSRENLHRIGVIRCPAPLYLFPTISASSPHRNPSCCATRLLDFELEPPQPTDGKTSPQAVLR